MTLEVPGTQRAYKVLVLDGSFGMATKGGDSTAFDRAKGLADQVVRDSPQGDGFSVVLMTNPARRIVSEVSEDSHKVAAEIQSLTLPHGQADLATTLTAVEDLLQHAPAKFPDREVYFFTDLRKSTWVAHQPAALAAFPSADSSPGSNHYGGYWHRWDSQHGHHGAFLNGIPGYDGNRHPDPCNHSEFQFRAREKVGLELWVGKARKQTGDPPFAMAVHREVRKLDHGLNTVTFAHRFTSPGDYVVQVRIDADALDLDDVRSMVVRVKDNVPILLVNGKPAAEAFDQGAEWVRLALNPFESAAVPGVLPLRPRVIDERQFADAQAGDLSPFDCVFLCDVARVTVPAARRLESHLRRRGCGHRRGEKRGSCRLQ